MLYTHYEYNIPEKYGLMETIKEHRG